MCPPSPDGQPRPRPPPGGRCPRQARAARLAGVVVGVVVGCLGGAALVLINLLLDTGQASPPETRTHTEAPFYPGHPPAPTLLTLRRSLYVGVLTMETYLSSRAASVNLTWARHPGISRVEYYARLGPESGGQHHGHHGNHHRHHQPPVINLTDIEGDDIYHRQASFRMLRAVCDGHIEEYDWFVRAVDDVYVKVDELLTLLTALDKDKVHYLGHPSLGETEAGVRAAGGRYYCLGGPAIVLSRPALLGLCPHLDDCARKFTAGPADVALGRCVDSVLGVQCRRASQFKKLFYNSYERNAFSLAEEFLTARSALSLHPVKTHWLMTAVHRQAARTAIQRLSQRLSWLRGRETSLAVTVMSQNSSRRLETRIEDLLPVPVTVMTSSYREMNAGSCSPVMNMTTSSRLKLSEAILVSNTSFLYGDRLRCRHLVDGHLLQSPPGGSTQYVTKMACRNVTCPGQRLLGRVVLRAPQRALEVRRTRDREVQNKLVVFLHAWYGDPKVMEFLVMWKSVMRAQPQRTSGYVLVLFLVYNPRRHRHAGPSEGPPGDMEFVLSDLDRWKRDNRLNIVTYPFNHSVSVPTMHHTALRDLGKRFGDAVILLAQPHLQFDEVFLQKCRLFVRPGKHIYRPYAEQNVIYKHVTQGSPGGGVEPPAVTETLWSEDFSPVCIHTTDLQRRRRRNKRKPLKVISSFDRNLHLDIL